MDRTYKKQNGVLSPELKQFLLVLCAIYPYDFELKEYNNYVLKDSVYISLYKSTQCVKMKDCLRELRKIVEPHPDGEKTYYRLLQILLQGGEFDDN